MNLNDFKMVNDDKNYYHLAHPSGKKMSVAKALLSGSAKKAIEKMCAGGEVQHYDEGTGPIPESLAVEPAAVPDALAVAPTQNVSAVPVEVAAPQPQPVVAVRPQVQPMDPLIQKGISTDQLLNQDQQNAMALGKAQQGAAGQEGKAFADFNKAAAQNMADHKAAEMAFKAKDDTLMGEYLNNKIDPDRYIHNMGTGSKIAAGISMIFGGLGQGLIGGKNPAVEWLNNAVNQDIESQKNEQGKTMNLWKMNREAMGDDQRANLATQNQLWTGVQAKLAQAGAGAKSAEAKFRAQQAVNDIEKQKVQNRTRLGLLTQGASGGTSTANPLDLVNDMVPKDEQKDVSKEIGQAQSAVKIEGNLKQLFDQAKNDARPATGMSTTSLLNAVPGYHPQSVNNLVALFDPLIHNNEGRINELEQQHIQALIPKFGDSDERVEQKWKGLQEFINHKKEAPLARKNGIDINNFSSTSDDVVSRLAPHDQAAVQWAKANPSNPSSAKILKANGL